MSLKTYINKVISPDDHSIDSNFMKIVLNRICDDLDSKTSKIEIGNLSDLNTTAKTNIVAAINEAARGGGAGFYAVPIVIEAEQESDEIYYSYRLTGEIDTDALASCTGISVVFEAPAVNSVITQRMGLTRHMVSTTSDGTEEIYEFGCGALTGEDPKTVGLAFADGELTDVQVNNHSLGPWEDPGEQGRE